MIRCSSLLLLLTLLAGFLSVYATPEAPYAKLKEQIGAKLYRADRSEVYVETIDPREFMLLFFSSSSCSACDDATERLLSLYQQHGGGTTFDIILSGADNSEEEMFAYMKRWKMPWLAAPYDEEQDYSPKLRKQYTGSESGIPRLVLLNPAGRVVMDDDSLEGRVPTRNQFFAALRTMLAKAHESPTGYVRPPLKDERTWTSVSGDECVASFESIEDNDRVRLILNSGKEVIIPRAKLSDQDRLFLIEHGL